MRRTLLNQLRGLHHRLEEGCVMRSEVHGLVDIDPSGDSNPGICFVQGHLVCDDQLCNHHYLSSILDQ